MLNIRIYGGGGIKVYKNICSISLSRYFAFDAVKLVLRFSEELRLLLIKRAMWPLGLLSHLSLFDTGCNNASVYGSSCDTPCPTNCKDNTCHILSGTCSTCKPGWTGVKCITSKMGGKRTISCFFPSNFPLIV